MLRRLLGSLMARLGALPPGRAPGQLLEPVPRLFARFGGAFLGRPIHPFRSADADEVERLRVRGAYGLDPRQPRARLVQIPRRLPACPRAEAPRRKDGVGVAEARVVALKVARQLLDVEDDAVGLALASGLGD